MKRARLQLKRLPNAAPLTHDKVKVHGTCTPTRRVSTVRRCLKLSINGTGTSRNRGGTGSILGLAAANMHKITRVNIIMCGTKWCGTKTSHPLHQWWSLLTSRKMLEAQMLLHQSASSQIEEKENQPIASTAIHTTENATPPKERHD